jgi:hypothetical protein
MEKQHEISILKRRIFKLEQTIEKNNKVIKFRQTKVNAIERGLTTTGTDSVNHVAYLVDILEAELGIQKHYIGEAQEYNEIMLAKISGMEIRIGRLMAND